MKRATNDTSGCCTRDRVARKGPYQRDGAGFTLVELMVAMSITTLLITLITPLFVAVSNSTTNSARVTARSAQGDLAMENLAAQIGSASEICLPTVLTTTGPTVTAGFAVRVLSLAFGKAEWDQWMLVGSTQMLEEQQWSTTWVTGNAVPPWLPVARSIVNTSTPPFSLPAPAAGSPQSLTVTLLVGEGGGAHTQNILMKSTIAALDTPYTPPSGSTACATTED